ncbi:MAG: hypothetical protein IJ190_08905 [Prevotella sp.]|nr:hypothetical protein [Prevotella sp.]
MVCKKSIVLFLITLLTSTSIWAQTEEIDGVTYDIVTIMVKTSISDAKPEFARVKYNKLCPLSITSDDMGRVEFVRNWAFFNGYPVFHSDFFGQLDDPMTLLEAPYNTTTQSWQEPELTATSWQPLTYSDGTGGVRRFTATSAIMPYKIENANYNFINPNMAKTMVRTGWSFAQHDVADNWPSGVSTDEQKQQYIREQLPIQSDIMENITGYGLKVVVEPNGNKNYMAAGIASDEVCWNIYQNASDGYPPQSKLLSYWTNTENGLPTTFANKPVGAWERFFFMDHENTLRENYIDTADGTSMILGGTHGMTNAALTLLKDISQSGTSAKKDQFWVAGADEVWEYYYLYHKASIQNVSYANGTLTFQVKVPRYKKSQFREMTINIPGVTDANGTDCTFSDNVVTGGAAKDTEGGRFVINFGIETSTQKYISQLLPLYRSHLHNEYLKRDIQYLIDLLVPGADKNTYQSQLDAEPNYSYTIKNSFGTTLLEGASDTNDKVFYKYPRYILSENKLYEAAKNTSNIQDKSANYVKSYTPTGTNQVETLNYAATAITGVSYYIEGEDITGVTIATRDISKITENSGEAFALRFASNGAAGEVKSPVTVTNIPKGKYTLVAAIGDTHTSSTAQFTFKVGDKSVLSLTTEDVSGYIKEYSKEGITIKTEQPLTIEAVNSGGSFWVDYLYLIKTGEYDESTPDVAFTTGDFGVDMTNDSDKEVTITANATAKETATITKTVIKNSNDEVVAESSTTDPTTCSYTFTPSLVGDIVFTAEATDDTENGGKTGLSDELTITVMSDFTLTATSNMGDNIGSIVFPAQTADLNYRFLYPRYLLKGTNLYETVARSNNSNQLHYGEELTFSLSNKNIERTINYNTLTATNIIFYVEGEDVEGVGRWTNTSFDKGQGQSFALTLGSMGTAGGFKSETQGSTTVTTLPAGQYQLTAIIGSTNAPATYSFKAGGTSIGSLTPTKSTESLTIYTTSPFTLEEDTPITISSTQGTGNSQNWVDLIYIQKLDDVPVTISSAGYATFSSPYALDFTNSNIKVYTATVDGNKVTMTKVNNAVPAATGLFLQGTVGTEVTKNIPLATSIPPTIENNALMPHLETGNVAAGNYVFSKDKNTGDLSFRKLANDTEVPGGRAYLSIPSEARNLTIEMDDVTGIHLVPIEPATLTSPAYNIQGLPVSEHTKGIIIRNGRKYINTKKQ